MAKTEKITIIEGPPPTFEVVDEPILLGLTESLVPQRIALCRLRSFNGPALVERCHRAWRRGYSISLEYRSDGGLTQQVPIIAARWASAPDGDLLMLWVSLEDDEILIEFDVDEDEDDDFNDDFGDSDSDFML
jgi:hypothetical protein